MSNILIHATGADWFVHQLISAIIHSAVYGMAYHIFKQLSLTEAIIAGGALLVLCWLIYKLFCNRTPAR